VTGVRLALLPLAAFVLAACGGGDTAPATAESPDAAPTGTGDEVETEPEGVDHEIGDIAY
jgi:hypothetical protein